MEWIENKDEWSNLNTIGIIRSVLIINGIESIKKRYFISSVTDIKIFAQAVRTNWDIENSLHRCLDMNFNKDRCRMRVYNSGENFTFIRHIATNLYKTLEVPKLSMKAKRFRCSFDDDFLLKVIFNKF